MAFRDIRIGLLAALALCTAGPALAVGVGLQPTTVESEVEPGDRQRQVVTIANVHQEKTISLTIGLADWSLDENGRIELAPPGEMDSSASDWVRFSPAFVTLEPGESEQVVVDMATPIRLDTSGDHRFALLASTILPEREAGRSGVWKKYQIASLFYLTANPARSLPEITGSSALIDADGAGEIEVLIENSGNAHARLEGEIAINAPGVSETLPIGNLVVLHGGIRRYVAPLPEGTPADAKITVKLENTFTPQSERVRIPLPEYAVPTVTERAAVDTGPR